MWSIPTFLTFPFTLPSIPTISLPASIQRRFLSYVLKRALGRFVKAGGLDVEKIQAQIGEGLIEVEGLELDTEVGSLFPRHINRTGCCDADAVQAVNDVLPTGFPFLIDSGSLGKATARLPFPNLWSDSLSLTLDSLTVDLYLPAPSKKGKESLRRSSVAPKPPLDLASSVTTAADDFLHGELDAYEEAELDRSIRQSLILSATDPFAQDEIPGAFPGFASPGSGPSTPLPASAESTTVLAGLVERILARLQVKVTNIRMRLHSEDTDHPAIFELRVEQVRYATETSTEALESGVSTRVVRFHGVEVYTTEPSIRPGSDRNRHGTPGPRGSSMSSSSTSGSEDRLAELAMSQGIADLRQSMASTIASGASIYASALTEPLPSTEEQDGDINDDTNTSNPKVQYDPGWISHLLSGPSRSTPSGCVAEQADTAQRIVSFGKEGITFRVTTRKAPLGISSPGDLRNDTDIDVASLRAVGPSLHLSLDMGDIALVLLPSQLASLLPCITSISQQSSANGDSDNDDRSRTAWQPRFDASVRIRSLHLVLIYGLELPSEKGFCKSLDDFLLQPATTFPPIGHLRLKFETLTAALASQPKRRGTYQHNGAALQLTFAISDASLFEYMVVKDHPSRQDSVGPQGDLLPILVGDPNLPLHSGREWQGRQINETTKNSRSRRDSFTSFEVIDWRDPSLKYSTEQEWKSRPKLKGALKVKLNSAVVEKPSPAILQARGNLAPSPCALYHMYGLLINSSASTAIPASPFP